MKLCKKFISALAALTMVLTMFPTGAQGIGIPNDESFIVEIPGLSISENDDGFTVLSDPADVIYDQESGILSWSLEAPAVTDHIFFIRLYNCDVNQFILSFSIGTSAKGDTPIAPDSNGIYSYQYFLPDELSDGTYYFDVCSVPSGPYTATHNPSNPIQSAPFQFVHTEPSNAPYRIDFYPNGGNIISIRGFPADQIVAGSLAAQENNIFVDQYSGIGMMMTNENGWLDSLPVIEREGYVLDGWYIVPSSVMTDNFLTDFTDYTKIGESTLYTSDTCLVAQWTKVSSPVGDFRFLSSVYNVLMGKEVQLAAYLQNGSELPKGTKITASCSSPNIIDCKSISMEIVGRDITDTTGDANDGDAYIMIDVEGVANGTVILTLELQDGRSTSCEINVENPVEFKAVINNPGNMYYVGETICVLVSDYMITEDGEKFAKPQNLCVNISNENVIHLQQAVTSLPGILAKIGEHVGLKNDVYVCYFFKAVSPGLVEINISADSTAGESIRIPIVVSDDPNLELRANYVDVYDWNWMGSEDEYNAIINGMVISDFDYDKRANGDYEFKFNVYNRSAMIGTVEIYNADNELIDIKIIDKATLPTDIGSVLVETWNGLIVQGIAKGEVFSFRSYGSNRTNFVDNPIIVPDGGHVIITNSIGASIPCLVLNCFDITIDTASFIKGTQEWADNSEKALYDSFIETFLTPDGQQKIIEKVEEKSLSALSKQEIISLFTDISSITFDVGDILLSSGLDVVTSKALGMIEDTTEGAPLKVVFSATGIANTVIQMNQFCDSVSSNRRMSIYTPHDRTPIVLPFQDMNANAYYAEAVQWAVEHAITTGTGDGTTFSPNLACDRGQVMTFLWRANGCPEPQSTVNPFTDVSENAYYYKAVLWAVENHITTGTGDGTTFSPDLVCTRDQAVTFLWRAGGMPTAASAVSFVDVPADAYYTSAVRWAVANNITAGMGNGTTFSPSLNCDRSQIVTFLYRTYA